MIDLESIHAFLRYNDWSNEQILRAAELLSDELLDRPFDMGRGTLRRTLLHLHAGEHVWVQRWQGRTETPWPDEDEAASAKAIAERFPKTYSERSAFLDSLQNGELEREVTYRDSKGSLFHALLGDMVMQAIIHSIHHRSQAVNMIRRLGGSLVELDYMTWVRRAASSAS